MKQGQRSRISLLLSIFLVLCHLTPIHGFASWLKCYVDLDESEVIMNYSVRSPEDAEHMVHVEVSPDDGATWQKGSELTVPAGKILARLRVPGPLMQEDVQYVMEVKGLGAEFLSNTMCGGIRAHATSYKTSQELRWDGKSSLTIHAGWATGHSPVNLTPKTILKPLSANEATAESNPSKEL